MTSVRRSRPLAVNRVWHTIAYCIAHRQQPTSDRVCRHLVRSYRITPDEARESLRMVLKDGLVRTEMRRRSKGGKQSEDITYRFPTEQVSRDRGDWYCGECHWPGRMTACSQCRMSFHPHCQLISSMSPTHSQFVCSMCQANISDSATISDVNTLLQYILRRVEPRLSQLSVADKSISSPSATDDTDIVRLGLDYMVYRPMSFSNIRNNVDGNRYVSLSEFESDVHLAVHNIVVMHGVGSAMSALAADLLGDCRYDVQEVRVCADCYRMSNEPRRTHWFCRPCSPPHRLVFAKHKGFPFWPAKVIRETDDGRLDVRFFGEPHERAQVFQNHVRPITEPLHRMRIKRSAGWSRAYDQLLRHQRLMSALSRDPSADINQLLDEPASANASNQRVPPSIRSSVSDRQRDDSKMEVTSSGVTTASADIAKDSAHLANLSHDLNDVSADVKDVSLDVNDVSSEVNDVSADVNDVSTDVNDVSSDVNDVSSEVNDVSADVNDVSDDINDVSANGISPSSNITKYSTDFSNSLADANSISADISNTSIDANKVSSEATDKPAAISAEITHISDFTGLSAGIGSSSAVGGVRSERGEGVLSAALSDMETDLLLENVITEAVHQSIHSLQTGSAAAAVVTSNGAVETCNDSTEIEITPPTHTSPPHCCPAENCLRQSQCLATLTEKHRQQLASLEQTHETRLALLSESHQQQLAALEQTFEARLAALEETHQRQISRVKHKQWCVNCEQEAIYHCCWNTAYCSTDCQQAHWQKEHKRGCRRKRVS